MSDNTALAADEQRIGDAPRRLLTQDLAAIPAKHVKLLNGMYVAAHHSLEHRALRWTWQPNDPIDHWVRLSSGRDRMWLGLSVARADPEIDFDWRACCGELRLVAWAAQFHRILDALNDSFGRDWIPEEFVADRALPKDGVEVGFAMTEQQLTTVTGRLVSATAFPSLTNRMPFEPAAVLQQLPIRIPLTVERLWFTPGQLREIEVGSVICIRRAAFLDIGARLTLQTGATTLLASLAAAKLTIVAIHPEPGHSPYSKETIVTDEATESDATLASAVDRAPVDVDSMPVELCFHAGYVTTSYAELRAVQPGYVFELGHNLRDQRIAITANGALIGHGELVAVGEHIGVRLTALGRSGAES